MKNAYFAGGCFWCIAAPYEELKGIKEIYSGFSGGEEINPSYQEVKAQLTNHRETICIQYDENFISYETLFDIYLNHIDPFDQDGQFIDRGHSYTLAVYYQNEEEKQIAENKIRSLENKTKKKAHIVLEKFQSFYVAEEKHQHYALKNKEAFQEELIKSGRKK